MARAEFDRGDAPADLPMQQMQLVLTRSAAQQADLDRLWSRSRILLLFNIISGSHRNNSGSGSEHRMKMCRRLRAGSESNGFHIDRVANGRNLIEFTGDAGQVENTFHTQIHKYMVNGRSHWANSSNPEIPAALAGVVAGVATLQIFRRSRRRFGPPRSLKERSQVILQLRSTRRAASMLWSRRLRYYLRHQSRLLQRD